MSPKSPLVLILGTAEWNAPIATNQHYVTRELARAFDILFAEGVGTRRPSLSLSKKHVVNVLSNSATKASAATFAIGLNTVDVIQETSGA